MAFGKPSEDIGFDSWAAHQADSDRNGNLPTSTVVIGDIQVSLRGVQKQGADGAAEAIYLIRTMPKAARPSPQGGMEIRMVRQLVQARG